MKILLTATQVVILDLAIQPNCTKYLGVQIWEQTMDAIVSISLKISAPQTQVGWYLLQSGVELE